MAEWTPEAERFLTEYLASVTDLSRKQGDDAQEIVDDLESHIRTEAEAEAGALVTVELLRKIINRTGTPEQVAGVESAGIEANPGPVAKPPEIPHKKPDKRPSRHIIFWIFSIGLPIISIVFETQSHMMADFYLNPMPNLFFLFLLLLVPSSFIVTQMYIIRGKAGDKRFAAWALILSGYATAVSVIYFIVFLPTLPLAIMGIIFFGLGLIGIAPLTCAIGGIAQTRWLYKKIRVSEIPVGWARWRTVSGLILGVLLLVVTIAPAILTSKALEMAISEDAKVKARGIWLIEKIGAEDSVLEECYGGTAKRGPFRGMAMTASNDLEKYRKLYFQMTGKAFNSVPKPKPSGANMQRDSESWDQIMVEDSEVGGAEVAGLVRGLSLYSSAIDISVASGKDGSAGPALAYIEWTMQFKNDSFRESEARASITLPHDAVVSRLTLWVEDVEQDAAFGSRRQVREAYKDVAVVKRRDPALITTIGPDRVLLQCFPIPPNGMMKVKVGITAPLIARDGKMYLSLPFFSERNFAIAKDFAHNLWAESKVELKTGVQTLKVEKPSEYLYAIRGKIGDRELQTPAKSFIILNAQPLLGGQFSAKLGPVNAAMTLKPLEDSKGRPQKVLLVVDGSASMANAKINWDAFLNSFSPSAVINAIFAGREVVVWKDVNVPVSPGAMAELAKWISGQRFTGGQDPAPALEKAIEMLSSGHSGTVLWQHDFLRGQEQTPALEKSLQRVSLEKRGTIIWIHGPLPVELSSAEGLNQWMRRRPLESRSGKNNLLSVDVMPGPNRIEQTIGYDAGIERVPVLVSLNDTLAFCAKNLHASDLRREYEVTTSEADIKTAPASVKDSSAHIARLAVNEKVKTLIRSSAKSDYESASKLAVMARVVTPTSGAVVLERKEQYVQHELDPTAAKDVIPVIPEPEEWALIIVVVLSLLYLVYREYRARLVWRRI